jgi:hypothetical protein
LHGTTVWTTAVAPFFRRLVGRYARWWDVCVNGPAGDERTATRTCLRCGR